MKKETKINAEEIHLLKIEVVSNKIDTAAFRRVSKPTLGIGHKVMHNLKDERIKIALAISFLQSEEKPLMEIQIDFHYYVKNLHSFYKLEEEHKPIFDGWMIATLLGIAVSTARGIIYEKLNANNIPNVIIPVISPKTLLQLNTNPS
jgi:hypothetical protein